MDARNLVALALMAACSPRGSAEVLTIHWQVDRATTTRQGEDIDDDEPTIALVAVGARDAIVHAGGGVGWCTADRNREWHSIYDTVCGAPPAGLVTRLVCGHDPHVDLVQCFDAVRTNRRLEISRREFAVTADDDAPPSAKLVEHTVVGGVDVPPRTHVRTSRAVSRDVVAK
jgi:hypothetical protein